MPQSGVSAPSGQVHRDELLEPEHDRAFASGEGVPGRRTVTIRGRGSERYTPPARGRGRRPSERAYERPGFRPDKVAMWAVLMCLVLVLVAATSSHAAVLSAAHALPAHASAR
jgi:hypothetical protein